MEAFGGKSVLLPSCFALNVLSLSLPFLLTGYYSQALFPIMDNEHSIIIQLKNKSKNKCQIFKSNM